MELMKAVCLEFMFGMNTTILLKPALPQGAKVTP